MQLTLVNSPVGVYEIICHIFKRMPQTPLMFTRHSFGMVPQAQTGWGQVEHFQLIVRQQRVIARHWHSE